MWADDYLWIICGKQSGLCANKNANKSGGQRIGSMLHKFEELSFF